jgi:hypothetical protein
MANGWTQERKAKQRAAISRWRPWEKSTGPRSKQGKARVGKNAWKHGNRSRTAMAESAAIRAMLRDMEIG